MSQREELIEKYSKIVNELKERFGIESSVILKRPDRKGVLPWVTGQEGVTLYAIIPKKESEKIKEVQRYLQTKFITAGIMHPVNEMMDLIRERGTITKQDLGGMGFIVPFLYHEEILGKYSREFRKQIQTNFGTQLSRAISERKKSLRDSGREIRKMVHERNKAIIERQGKIIGPLERKEIEEALKEMAKNIHQQNGQVLIVFDKSGRPLALPLKRILRKVYGQEVKIFFINPSKAKSVQDQEKLLRKLRKENPGVIEAVSGKNVVLVDDQIWQGKSFSTIAELLRKLSAKNISAEYMSQYPTRPNPSWRIHKIHAVTEPTGRRIFVGKRRKLNAKKALELQRVRKRMDFIAKRIIRQNKR